MASTPQQIEFAENPMGNGWVYKGKQLIAEVSYDLQVFHNLTYNKTSVNIVVTGKIKAINRPDILWGVEQLTLRLSDKRKLDFMCVDFTPECNIASVSDFYL